VERAREENIRRHGQRERGKKCVREEIGDGFFRLNQSHPN